MSFKSQREIYEALLAGKKIFSRNGVTSKYFYLNSNGTLVNEEGDKTAFQFYDPSHWSIYEEPKKKKKITLYRYTYNVCALTRQTEWTSAAWENLASSRGSSAAPLKTETKEIEIEVDE